MTNQQSNVLIALSHTSSPRTLDAMSAELGYPKASIRRVLSQLGHMEYIIVRDPATGMYDLKLKPVASYTQVVPPSSPSEVIA